MTKTIVDVPVEVNEPSLLMRGWRAIEARARVTSDMWHTLSLSTTFEFSEREWSARYTDSDRLAPVVLEISNPRLGETRYVNLYLPNPTDVRAGKVRSSISDTIAYDIPNFRALDLQLKLTCFDDVDVSGQIAPLPKLVRTLAADFEESSMLLDAFDIELDVDAYIGGSDEINEAVVCIRGQLTPASYGKLVEVTHRRDEWRDEGEFDIPLPNVEVDILDDTDFLLTRLDAYHLMRLEGTTDGAVPDRPAEWLDYLTIGVDELAGEPTKVVVRLVDQ
ncbi:hypothetical protein [Mycobacterium sp. 852014-52144_SCH5372336]|uniref:hypothetical protein n=1 Tax=Mycobacterium sp. 852014-52144_SCH5372336 TaxID=1834115 RepID=UPI000B334E7E|nr:hypothetical protein [Mycobacterium sp. 852014-52144_SCH5372336]